MAALLLAWWTESVGLLALIQRSQESLPFPVFRLFRLEPWPLKKAL